MGRTLIIDHVWLRDSWEPTTRVASRTSHRRRRWKFCEQSCHLPWPRLAITRRSGTPGHANRTQLSFVDIKRAYFNAKINESDEPTFVALSSEDPDHGTMCGQLFRHMYGTRGAADGWQEEYSTTLIGIGFQQGVSCPNVFRHIGKSICCSVHGVDFTSQGGKQDFDWFEAEIAKHYGISIDPRLGPGPYDAKEGRCLNRMIRWCDGHIEYEADPRQAEKLIAECGLEGPGVKQVATPGVELSLHELEEDKALP